MSSCRTDADCPFLFNCHQDELQCHHNDIFPLQLYPCIIYLFFPIAVGMVNMTGNSMGIFKVLLLMNLLRYDISGSTAMVQPMVAGAALPNFFNIIFRKHPNWKASLVDFNIVYILIPCCLLGSTLGSFVQKFTPEIIEDILVVLFFSYFAWKFVNKIKALLKQDKTNPIGEEEAVKDSFISNGFSEGGQARIGHHLSEEQSVKRASILKYEDSVHLPDILSSFGVFLVFEFLVFLVQGKFSFYKVKICSGWYFGGLAALILITVGYLFLIRKRLREQFTLYKQLEIPFNLDLSKQKIFGLIGLGGFTAGLVQGILGVGSGTFIMGVFLTFNLNPRVASATSGYQIFFIGAASFTEGFITNSISLKDAMFLFWLCAIAGGAVTFGMYWFLKKKEQKKVSRLLISVMAGLCVISVVGVFPSAYLTWKHFGWKQMIEVKFHC